MRPIILVNNLGVGGSETKTVRLANEFVARGKPVFLAYLQYPETLLPLVNKKVPTGCLHRKRIFSITALRNLRRVIRKHEISVVLCMNLYPMLYAVLLKLFSPGHGSLKVVLAINTTHFEYGHDRRLMSIYAPLIRRVDAVIYGCKNQMDLWLRKYDLRRVPSQVIYNGVDTDFFNPARAPGDLRDELGIANNCVIGCIGRLAPEKKQSALLNVVAQLDSNGRRIDVILVGTGPERERLEQQSSDLGIKERVHFLGQMQDVRAALATLDVFVLPSVSVETFSNAALEAMAMSLPVVLSDIAGASEMIINGDNGFLYEKSDMDRLAELLARLESDRRLRKHIGQRARETVLDRFNFVRMIDDYESALGSV